MFALLWLLKYTILVEKEKIFERRDNDRSENHIRFGFVYDLYYTDLALLKYIFFFGGAREDIK